MNSELDPQHGSDGSGTSGTHNPVVYYKDSGIQERHGHIPLWLLAVVVALTIWGIYYLVAFWSPPA